MQEDIEDVSRTARQVKNRLERLDKVNEQALSRKVRLACPIGCVVTISQLTCPCMQHDRPADKPCTSCLGLSCSASFSGSSSPFAAIHCLPKVSRVCAGRAAGRTLEASAYTPPLLSDF